jgi:hypothetical protein
MSAQPPFPHFGDAHRWISASQFPKFGAAPPATGVRPEFIIWLYWLLFAAPDVPEKDVRLPSAAYAADAINNEQLTMNNASFFINSLGVILSEKEGENN